MTAQGMAFSARCHLSAKGYRVLDMVFHFLYGGRIDQGALFCIGRGTIAHLQRGYRGAQGLDKAVIYAVLYIDTVGANAGLTHIAELRGDHTLDGAVQVRIVENQDGCIAA